MAFSKLLKPCYDPCIPLTDHRKLALNEQADQLAKQGTTSQNIRRPPRTWASVKRDVSGSLIKEWNRRWKDERTCRQTRLMLPQISSNFTKYLFQLDRIDASTVIQFVTGHNHLWYHQFKCGHNVSPTCRLCDLDDETAWHLLTNCLAVMHSRVNIFLTYEITKIPHIKPLLELLKLESIRHLLKPIDCLDRTTWICRLSR